MMNVPITCDYYFVCKLIDSSKVISYLGGYSPFGPIDIIAVIHEHGSFFFFFFFVFQANKVKYGPFSVLSVGKEINSFVTLSTERLL